MSKSEETPATRGEGKPQQPQKSKESMRDTIESILFAFVLAFLFRTFEAEAFVIPTGSMAPTLYGRHKEADCEKCGYHIVVGASHEVVPETGYLAANSRTRSAICPNCGYENDNLYDALAFNGDRILVNKFTYEFWKPSRWDVFVFKYPTEPQTNYIKRLVGLPGDKLQIRNGNLYQLANDKVEVLRKSPVKQRAIQIPVYDDNHPPRELLAAGWPERWAAMRPAEIGRIAGWTETDSGWQADADARTYHVTRDDSSQRAWLRYRHYFSMPTDWVEAAHQLPLDPQARLIGDFCGYNASTGEHQFDAHSPQQIDFGPFWVADLTVHMTLDMQETAEGAELLLELCEGTAWYRCRINPRTGAAVLEEVNSQMNGRTRELAQGSTGIQSPGEYDIAFANVDDRLCLWVDDSLIDFGDGANLDAVGATGNPFPTDQDLTPVGIAAEGITATVSNLLLERDLYYRVGEPGQYYQIEQNRLAEAVTDPEEWAALFSEFSDKLGQRTMEVAPGHYLAFGDNSPQSNDSRMWELGRESVPQKLLVGKAFWIYWPHGVPFLNGGRGFPVTYHREHVPNDGIRKVDDYPRYTFPFYPQFWRMHRIR